MDPREASAAQCRVRPHGRAIKAAAAQEQAARPMQRISGPIARANATRAGDVGPMPHTPITTVAVSVRIAEQWPPRIEDSEGHRVPSRRPTACAYPGCPAKMAPCQEHSKRPRLSASARGYDYRWQRFRLLFLARNPLCVQCAEEGRVTPAVDLHHRIPLRIRPDLRLEPRNIDPLCRSHHARIKDDFTGEQTNDR